MPYTTITTEGGLLPVDILDAIAAEELPGQRAEDFGLEKSRRLGDEIAAAWGDIRVFWDAFQRGLRRLRESDTATSITREQWMIPFLRALGYELKYMPSAAVVEGRTYAISHRAGDGEAAPPVHVEGIRTSLDARPPTGRPRLSPHALVQEYLNSTEHLWGIVTNGERLRLLRDSSRMTRPAYVEFDLPAMLEGEKFSEFAVLYRLLHRTRMPYDGTDATACHLERYHQLAIESGGRVREKLRVGVEKALRVLGNGLIGHPANAALRAKVAAGDGHNGPSLSPLDFYRQLLRLVYRLLFLMVAEERNLIAAEDDVSDPLSPLAYRPSANDRLAIYRQHYSIGRLRRMAEQRGTGRGPYDDLWLGLMQTFRLLEGSDEESPRKLGLAALDGDLFGAQAIGDLEGTRVRNADLLQAIAALSLYSEKESKTLRRVNYAALDVEELGSVYESLLDYRPVMSAEGQLQPAIQDHIDARFFNLVTGTERKTTGSYYTRPELVHELIKSALDPVIEDRLKDAGPDAKARERTLLALRVVDPAAGSGHFLLAAARRIGRALAKVRSGEEQPTPTEFRRAVRDVIQHCIYGVDLNPLAVDLCKLALWIEGHNAGMPLSFLDHHIKQGNSLIGATRALVDAGIPDDAYKAVTGDDKATASAIKKRNKTEREAFERTRHVQEDMFGHAQEAGHSRSLVAELDRLDALEENSVAAVRAKAARYRKLRDEAEAERTAFNLWTAAFFQPLTAENAKYVPTTKDLLDHQRHPKNLTDPKVAMATALAGEASFFHWELEFPQVFEGEPSTNDPRMHEYAGGESFVRSSRIRGRHGFDVVLGNPPWERIKLQEQEHWVDVPEIRDAANKDLRAKAIQAWRASDDPAKRKRVAQFDAAKYRAEAESRFVRASGRFPLTAVGDVNYYALFAELDRTLLADLGRAGIVCPPGIASDDTNKRFFGSLMAQRNLASLIAFVNEKMIFPGVLHNFRFCALTLTGCKVQVDRSDFVYECQTFEEVKDEKRHFTLSLEDLLLLNPNTNTAPVFRSNIDAELTKRIYRRVPVLVNEQEEANPWEVTYRQGLFHSANDSDLFGRNTSNDMFDRGAKLQGNTFLLNEGICFPLYEAKMIDPYNHRLGSFSLGGERSHILPETNLELLANSMYRVLPHYWIKAEEVANRLVGRWDKNWLLVFRDVTTKALERTATFTIIPLAGATDQFGLLLLNKSVCSFLLTCLLANLNSLVLDYVARLKISGMHLKKYILYQLPVLQPSTFSADDIAFIVPRVLELVYTAWDMRPFAEDVWNELSGQGDDAGNGGGGRSAAAIDASDVRAKHSPATRDQHTSIRANASPPRETSQASSASPAQDTASTSPIPSAAGTLTPLQAEILRRNAECNADAPTDLFARRDGFPLPPFRWSEERRALIRAELDARIAKLYGLTRDELRYILDPADVYGPDFPGETFRVLKEKEAKQFGEYRTRRLVLEAWDKAGY